MYTWLHTQTSKNKRSRPREIRMNITRRQQLARHGTENADSREYVMTTATETEMQPSIIYSVLTPTTKFCEYRRMMAVLGWLGVQQCIRGRNCAHSVAVWSSRQKHNKYWRRILASTVSFCMLPFYTETSHVYTEMGIYKLDSHWL